MPVLFDITYTNILAYSWNIYIYDCTIFVYTCNYTLGIYYFIAGMYIYIADIFIAGVCIAGIVFRMSKWLCKQCETCTVSW